MIDSVMMNTGAIVLIVGGCLLLAAGVGLAALLVANIWISASNKWRRILRAESLIYETFIKPEYPNVEHTPSTQEGPYSLHLEVHPDKVFLALHFNGQEMYHAYSKVKGDKELDLTSLMTRADSKSRFALMGKRPRSGQRLMETYRVFWNRLASSLDRAWLAVSDGKRTVQLHLPHNVPALSQPYASRNALRLTQHK